MAQNQHSESHSDSARVDGDLKYDLIEEEPITSTEQDEFGHTEYIHSIYKLLKGAEEQQHIALYGPWGSGKTSLVKMLFKEHLGWGNENTDDQDHPSDSDPPRKNAKKSPLDRADSDDGMSTKSDTEIESEENIVSSREDEPTILPVYFNVWRHAQDSIQTDLLLTITDELERQIGNEARGDKLRNKLSPSESVKELRSKREVKSHLYDEIEREKYDEEFWRKLRYSLMRVLNNAPIVSVGLVFIMALSIVYAVNLGITPLVVVASVIVSAPFIFKIMIYIDKISQDAVTYMEGPRHAYSGAYESLFKNQIEAITRNESLEFDRVVIAIDDLDRCDSDVVNDVLVGLKTFLDHDDCTYILPCEESALHSHVSGLGEGEYFEEKNNKESYLQKFIDVEIGIPEFKPDDINVYAEKKNSLLEHPLDSQTLEILSEEDRATPRQAIRAINRVQTTRNIAHDLETHTHTSEPVLQEESVTDEPNFIAKMLVLEDRFPEFYQYFRRNPEVYEQVSHFYASGDRDAPDELRKMVDEVDVEIDHLEELESFLTRWKDVRVSDPRPFLQIGQPAGEFTARHQFAHHVTSGSAEQARSMIEQAVELNNIERLQSFVDILRGDLYQHPKSKLGAEEIGDTNSENSKRKVTEIVEAEFGPEINEDTRIYLAEEEPLQRSLADRIGDIVYLRPSFGDIEYKDTERKVIVELGLDIWQQFEEGTHSKNLCNELQFDTIAPLIEETAAQLDLNSDEQEWGEDIHISEEPSVKELFSRYIYSITGEPDPSYEFDQEAYVELATSKYLSESETLSFSQLSNHFKSRHFPSGYISILLETSISIENIDFDSNLQDILLSELDTNVDDFINSQPVFTSRDNIQTLVNQYRMIDGEVSSNNRSKYVSCILSLGFNTNNPDIDNIKSLSLPSEWPAGLEYIFGLETIDPSHPAGTNNQLPMDKEILRKLDSLVEAFIKKLSGETDTDDCLIDYRYFRIMAYLASISSKNTFRKKDPRRRARIDRGRINECLNILSNHGNDVKYPKAIRELIRVIRQEGFNLYIPGNEYCKEISENIWHIVQLIAEDNSIEITSLYTDYVRIILQEQNSEKNIASLCFDCKKNPEKYGLDSDRSAKILFQCFEEAVKESKNTILRECYQLAPKRPDLAIELFRLLQKKSESPDLVYQLLYAEIASKIDGQHRSECPPNIHFELVIQSEDLISAQLKQALLNAYRDTLTAPRTPVEVRKQIFRFLPILTAMSLQDSAIDMIWFEDIIEYIHNENSPINVDSPIEEDESWTSSKQELQVTAESVFKRINEFNDGRLEDIDIPNLVQPSLTGGPATESETVIEWETKQPEIILKEVR